MYLYVQTTAVPGLYENVNHIKKEIIQQQYTRTIYTYMHMSVIVVVLTNCTEKRCYEEE